MKEYKYSDALIHFNLRQLALQNNLPSATGSGHHGDASSLVSARSLCFEGSFETEPNHQAQLFIILGNGLLLCRWNQTKEHRLKFQAFYPWNSFFSVSNRPGTKVLIATFKLPPTPTSHGTLSRSKQKLKALSSSKLPSPSASGSSMSRTVSSSFSRAINTQKELRLHLKSPKLAEKVARKLLLQIRQSNRQ